MKRPVDSAVETHGGIAVTLDNAGLMPQSPLERLKVDEWDNVIDITIKRVLPASPAAFAAEPFGSARERADGVVRDDPKHSSLRHRGG